MGKNLLYCVSMFLVALCSPASWADVHLAGVSDPIGGKAVIMDVEVSGTIQKGDSETFAVILRAFSDYKRFVRVTLNSAGGNIEEALRVGQQIRDVRGYVSVPVGAECAVVV